ncbi:MAG: hypothetical protein KC547_09925 [Anaerolineae bacterium]|nr:hypothetical protein [Anaerolineae bacterium]MCA9907925.1 hypothetical protein [Anaerolineae bacterium]
MRTLNLDAGWTCTYVGLDTEPVAQLDAWRFSQACDDGCTASLNRQFVLYPTDECVSYLLQIDSAPEGTQLSVNGHRLGAVMAPCTLDVTAFVSLEDNDMTFQVGPGAQGTFAGIRLQAIACE